jgi:magnesium chelatase family protein
VDRFEILFFTDKRRRYSEEVTMSGREILEKLESSRQWLRERGRGPMVNARRPMNEIESEVDSFFFKHMMNKDLGSERRYQATLRVARTLADLERAEFVQGPHVERALKITWVPFEKLKRWD